MVAHRTAALLPVLVVIALAVTAATAAAEHRASHATFNAINRVLGPSARTIDDHLTAVWISDKDHGPWALATESGGQGYRVLMREVRGRWRVRADVGASTGLPCSAAPPAVRRDLHLLRYVPQHRCIA